MGCARFSLSVSRVPSTLHLDSIQELRIVEVCVFKTAEVVGFCKFGHIYHVVLTTIQYLMPVLSQSCTENTVTLIFELECVSNFFLLCMAMW